MIGKSNNVVLDSNISVYNSDFCSLPGNEVSNIPYIKSFYSGHLSFMFDSFSGRDVSVLDFCCGSGNLTLLFYPFLSSGSSLVALDVSSVMLDKLRSKLSRIDLSKTSFVCSDVVSHFLSDVSCYDVVSVAGALHHIVDYYSFIDLACKRVKSGGFFYINLEPKGLRKGLLFRLFRFVNNFSFVGFFRGLLFRLGLVKRSVAFDKYLSDYACSEFSDCLDFDRVKNIFFDNGLVVVKFGDSPYFRYEWLFSLSKFFGLDVNEYFFLIGKKGGIKNV